MDSSGIPESTPMPNRKALQIEQAPSQCPCLTKRRGRRASRSLLSDGYRMGCVIFHPRRPPRGTLQAARLRAHPVHQTSARFLAPPPDPAPSRASARPCRDGPVAGATPTHRSRHPKIRPKSVPPQSRSPKFRNHIPPVLSHLASSQPNLRPLHPYNLFECAVGCGGSTQTGKKT